MAGQDFAGLSAEGRRLVLYVTGINLSMFVLAFAAGRFGGSQALMADALDFLAFGAGYGLSLWAVGRPKEQQAIAGLVKAAGLVALGAWLGVTTLYQFFVRAVPEAEVMALIGLVGLGANGLVLYLLQAQRTDKRLGPMWLAARNDMIGTGAVIVAAGLVALLNSSAPDLIAGGVMVALFLMGAVEALRVSYAEWRKMQA